MTSRDLRTGPLLALMQLQRDHRYGSCWVYAGGMGLLVQVIMPHRNGLAADRTINTFHTLAPEEPLVASCIQVMERIEDFYTEEPVGGTFAVGAYLGSNLNHNADACEMRCYNTLTADVDPIATQTWTLPAENAGSPKDLPREVALCCSYKQKGTSGDVARTQRGRIYVGPFNASALGTEDDPLLSGTRPSCALVTTIALAGFQLRAALAIYDPADGISGTYAWCVHSTKGSTPGSSPPDLQVDVPIDTVWCDNAWDTQRRRGEKPTSRAQYTT